MKNKMKKMVLPFLIIVIFMVTGCKEGNPPSDTPTHTVIVCGSHANTAYTSFLNTEEVKSTVMESTESFGSVTLIVSDGQPFVAEKFQINGSEKKLSNKKKTQIASQQADQILATAKEIKTVTPEVDLLSALQLADRSLSGVDGKKQIIVIDSGLSTAGKVNFFNSKLLEEIGMEKQLYKFLDEEKELPGLDGVDVLWMGLGDTAGQQEACPAAVRDTLKKVWETVLTGAKSVTFSSAVPGNEPERDLPSVSVVEYPEDKVFEPVVFDNKTLMFQADSTELADISAAKAVLLPMVNELKDNRIQIAIFGTTATVGSNNSCIAFSEARAQTVKDILVDMGLPEDQIAYVKGLGYNNIFHTDDRLPDGTLDPLKAEKNRSVIVMSIDDAKKNNLI